MMRKILVCVLFCGLAATASAQQLQIILATLAPKDSPWYQVLEKMGADWRKISNGNVTLSIRPGGTVGDEPEAVKRLRLHSIQAVGLSGVGMSLMEPGVACLQIPMMFDSYAELDYVRERMAPKLAEKLAAKGYIVLNWGDVGWVHFFSTKPVTRIGDLRKLKLFTWAGDSDEEELWKANGFHPVPLAATDIAQQLMTGGLEAVPTTPLYAETGQVYQTAKYMCDVKWAPLIGATIVEKATWMKIPETQRSQMMKAAKDAETALGKGIRAMNDKALDTMQAGQPGKRSSKLSVMHVEAEILAEWRKQTEAVYPKLKGKMIPADLFGEVQKLHEEYLAQHPRNAKDSGNAGEKKDVKGTPGKGGKE
jgi:TRAP-type transport system periplasmic protein